MLSGRTGADPPTVFGGGQQRLLGRGYQGAVYLREGRDGTLIAKVPIGSGPARAARRAMLEREHRVYERLRGIAGVPRCLGFANGEELLLEYVPGPSLRDAQLTGAEREHFFAELLRVIRAMHDAGVAHGDLKRKDNILRGPGGQPFLIDFGTALVADERAGPLRLWLFRQACRVDLNAWVKLKYQRQELDMDPADALIFRPTLPERVARAVRRAWRAATLRRHRR
jgi:predicted Ser/Thr protein kinase